MNNKENRVNHNYNNYKYKRNLYQVIFPALPVVIDEELYVSTQVYLVYICFDVLLEQYFDGSKLLSIVSSQILFPPQRDFT